MKQFFTILSAILVAVLIIWIVISINQAHNEQANREQQIHKLYLESIKR